MNINYISMNNNYILTLITKFYSYYSSYQRLCYLIYA